MRVNEDKQVDSDNEHQLAENLIALVDPDLAKKKRNRRTVSRKNDGGDNHWANVLFR